MDERIALAKRLYLAGGKIVEIARETGMSETTIGRWKKKEGWQRQDDGNRLTAVLDRRMAKAVEKNDLLTDRQKDFCLYYVKSFNATQAYQKAYGCSYKVASKVGYRLMSKPQIKEEIVRLRQIRSAGVLAGMDDVMEKLCQIAFADITDYLEWGFYEVEGVGEGNIPPENSVRFKDSSQVDGTLLCEVRKGRDGVSFKMADRMRALDMLCRLLGAVEEDGAAKEKNGEVVFRIIPAGGVAGTERGE